MTTDTSAEALERQRFEEWSKTKYPPMTYRRRIDGQYWCATIENMWQGWQGCVAAEKLLASEHCMCPACAQGLTHDSDCAVHNEPAIPIGPCNCSKRPSIDAAMQGRPNGVFEMMGLPELPPLQPRNTARGRGVTGSMVTTAEKAYDKFILALPESDPADLSRKDAMRAALEAVWKDGRDAKDSISVPRTIVDAIIDGNSFGDYTESGLEKCNRYWGAIQSLSAISYIDAATQDTDHD